MKVIKLGLVITEEELTLVNKYISTGSNVFASVFDIFKMHSEGAISQSLVTVGVDLIVATAPFLEKEIPSIGVAAEKTRGQKNKGTGTVFYLIVQLVSDNVLSKGQDVMKGFFYMIKQRSKLLLVILCFFLLPFSAAQAEIENSVQRHLERLQKIEECNMIIEQDPNSVKAYNNRRNLYMYDGQYELALKDNNKLLEMYPKNKNYYGMAVTIYAQLGKKLENNKQYDQAIEAYTKWIDYSEKAHEFPTGGKYRMRGELYQKMGRHDLAKIDLEKADAIDKKNQDNREFAVGLEVLLLLFVFRYSWIILIIAGIIYFYRKRKK